MQVEGPGVFIRWYLLCFASCVREGRVWKGDKLGPNEPSVFSSDKMFFLKKRGTLTFKFVFGCVLDDISVTYLQNQFAETQWRT